MMESLGIERDSVVRITSCDLPDGSFVTFQPLEKEFVDAISDHRAVLEHELRAFPALTEGDVFRFHYNNQDWKVRVLHLEPAKAVSILNTDIIVDFEAFEGSTQSEGKKLGGEKEYNEEDHHAYDPLMVVTSSDSFCELSESVSGEEVMFAGESHCISGKKLNQSTLSNLSTTKKKEDKKVVLEGGQVKLMVKDEIEQRKPQNVDKLDEIIQMREERKKKEDDAKKNLLSLSGRPYQLHK
eukprot:TRINITY_DN3010_c0_g1_i3.p1 TRINITY_DN3010_c0_g1~~TRINITY_DN3010_c0_g1_i3.p1  ORF type:complete len:240 (-),score=65.76 TRINITY_DN3010_c0_g1_i3:89-808(-)